MRRKQGKLRTAGRQNKILRRDRLEELVVKKFYGENELRRMYLDFFKSKRHLAWRR